MAQIEPEVASRVWTYKAGAWLERDVELSVGKLEIEEVCNCCKGYELRLVPPSGPTVRLAKSRRTGSLKTFGDVWVAGRRWETPLPEPDEAD